MSKELQYAWMLGGIVAAIFGLSSGVHAQQMGAGASAIGAGTIPGTPFGGAVDPSMVQVREGFQVIPSVSVGERYDSNVYFVPKKHGLDRHDFVSTAVPQLRGYYVGDSFDVNAMASAIGEYYAKNTNLNYVGTNTGIALSLSKLLDRWWQGATLTVSDTYLYTPQAPSFLTGNLTGVNANPYATGFQTGRVNVSRNVLSTDLAMPLNQTFSMTGSYSNGFLRYGATQAQQPALIDSDFQSYTAGLSMKASPQDILSVKSVNSDVNFQPSSKGSYSTRGGNVGWEHTFSPFLTMTSHAGAVVLQRELVGVSQASQVVPVGDLALLWKDRTTAMTLSYALGVSPSVQFNVQALRTQVVSLAVTQQTGIPELLAVANVNYGFGDQYGSSTGAAVSYATVGGTGGLVYKFTPQTFLGVNYSYMNVDNNSGGKTFAYDRQVVQVSLTQAFY